MHDIEIDLTGLRWTILVTGVIFAVLATMQAATAVITAYMAIRSANVGDRPQAKAD